MGTSAQSRARRVRCPAGSLLPQPQAPMVTSLSLVRPLRDWGCPLCFDSVLGGRIAGGFGPGGPVVRPSPLSRQMEVGWPYPIPEATPLTKITFPRLSLKCRIFPESSILSEVLLAPLETKILEHESQNRPNFTTVCVSWSQEGWEVHIAGEPAAQRNHR